MRGSRARRGLVRATGGLNPKCDRGPSEGFHYDTIARPPRPIRHPAAQRGPCDSPGPREGSLAHFRAVRRPVEALARPQGRGSHPDPVTTARHDLRGPSRRPRPPGRGARDRRVAPTGRKKTGVRGDPARGGGSCGRLGASIENLRKCHRENALKTGSRSPRGPSDTPPHSAVFVRTPHPNGALAHFRAGRRPVEALARPPGRGSRPDPVTTTLRDLRGPFRRPRPPGRGARDRRVAPTGRAPPNTAARRGLVRATGGLNRKSEKVSSGECS